MDDSFTKAMRRFAAALVLAGVSLASAGLALNRSFGGRLAGAIAVFLMMFAFSCTCISLCFRNGVF